MRQTISRRLMRGSTMIAVLGAFLLTLRASPAAQTVMVNSNGVVTWPTNLWTSNSVARTWDTTNEAALRAAGDTALSNYVGQATGTVTAALLASDAVQAAGLTNEAALRAAGDLALLASNVAQDITITNLHSLALASNAVLDSRLVAEIAARAASNAAETAARIAGDLAASNYTAAASGVLWQAIADANALRLAGDAAGSNYVAGATNLLETNWTARLLAGLAAGSNYVAEATNTISTNLSARMLAGFTAGSNEAARVAGMATQGMTRIVYSNVTDFAAAGHTHEGLAGTNLLASLRVVDPALAGADLASNGSFTNGASWWDISGFTPNAAGSNLYLVLGASGSIALTNGFSPAVYRTYMVTFDRITSDSGESITVALGSVSNVNAAASSGTTTNYLTAISTNGLRITASAPADSLWIDNVRVYLVTSGTMRVAGDVYVGGTIYIPGGLATGTPVYAEADTMQSVMARGNVSTTAMAQGVGVSAPGKWSHAQGYNTTASGQGSHAEGDTTTASGPGSHADGSESVASGIASHSDGFKAMASNVFSWVWAGSAGNGMEPEYGSHGDGSFSVNPLGGVSGFWVGETNLGDLMQSGVAPFDVPPTNPPTAGYSLKVDANSNLYYAADLTGGEATDHGSLTGLLDDDHTQYLPTSGVRVMSATLPIRITDGFDALTIGAWQGTSALYNVLGTLTVRDNLRPLGSAVASVSDLVGYAPTSAPSYLLSITNVSFSHDDPTGYVERVSARVSRIHFPTNSASGGGIATNETDPVFSAYTNALTGTSVSLVAQVMYGSIIHYLGWPGTSVDLAGQLDGTNGMPALRWTLRQLTGEDDTEAAAWGDYGLRVGPTRAYYGSGAGLTNLPYSAITNPPTLGTIAASNATAYALAGHAHAGYMTNGQVLAYSQYPLALTNFWAFDAAGTAATVYASAKAYADGVTNGIAFGATNLVRGSADSWSAATRTLTYNTNGMAGANTWTNGTTGLFDGVLNGTNGVFFKQRGTNYWILAP